MSCDIGEELILKFFRHFTYVTAHSPTLPSLYLRHSSFSKQSRAHSQIFPSLHLRYSSFSNRFVALSTPQLILQPFRCFTYVTAHSLTLISLLLRHRLFTYVTCRAAHGDMDSKDEDKISGYSTVEQATTVSLIEMEEGVAQMPSTS